LTGDVREQSVDALARLVVGRQLARPTQRRQRERVLAFRAIRDREIELRLEERRIGAEHRLIALQRRVVLLDASCIVARSVWMPRSSGLTFR
jgi:hypothetical protein